MGRRHLGAFIAIALVATACGVGAGEAGTGVTDPDAPLLQIRSEGGFAPTELILGSGPTYTVLADGRLIDQGPTIAIYPGPLVPNYQVGIMNEDDMGEILQLVSEIGLPDMIIESDDSAADHVADANTVVATFWDEDGPHVFSVYALGIDPAPGNPRVAAFATLVDRLAQTAGSIDARPYDADRARVIAGVSMADPEPDFVDVRDWPLDEGMEDWEELSNGWVCTSMPGEVLDRFGDATQVTQWRHPDPMMDAPVYTLLVRPLLPGEDDCPASR